MESNLVFYPMSSRIFFSKALETNPDLRSFRFLLVLFLVRIWERIE